MPDFDLQPAGSGGEAYADVFVSRPDIARLAGVKRPAVSNWERRYPDYPPPAVPQTSADPEQFRADEVLAWLSGRTVPVNALRPGEPTGTTYGDRFRAGLAGGNAGGMLAVVRELVGPGAERMRGPVPLPLYFEWLLHHVVLAILTHDEGASTREALALIEREPSMPEGYVVRGLANAVQERLDRNPPGSPEEARQAFDLLLGLLRDADAGDGGDFLTPPSVSRTMAGALAAVQPAASVPHDPYCRVGELLAAYLDAAAVHGSQARGASGRVLGERDLGHARANLVVHGAERDLVELDMGPFAPAMGSANSPGAFDTVLTNPPFGRRLPEDVSPPSYWRYGPARRTEFDWLQYVVSLLTPRGRAAVLMPAGAAFNEGAARTVRTGLVEEGVVECVMALPAQLFERTAIRTHIWFLRAPGVPGASEGNVLFVAGEHLGHGVTRTRRALADDDITRLIREYGSWCEGAADGRDHPGTPGLSTVATPAEIAAHDNSLEPALYVRPTETGLSAVTDPAAVRHRLGELAGELDRLHAWAGRVQADVDQQLGRYGL
ncbi:N-6 DNA methylase [Streptomyces sp. enrichment culture]|uniref:N-6 DNA methylase n=1 Tax=Streptomyces sp. enrichment culture TaxID=1795815 RepID=UPI003F5662E9